MKLEFPLEVRKSEIWYFSKLEKGAFEWPYQWNWIIAEASIDFKDEKLKIWRWLTKLSLLFFENNRFSFKI